MAQLRDWTQSGSDVREVYSEAAGQVNKPDFFRKIS